MLEKWIQIGALFLGAAITGIGGLALCKVNDINLTPQEMIMTALWAENQYVGVSCGKLDQSCEVLSRRNHLLYLDTKDDSYELIPSPSTMKPYSIAIFFSGLERALASSKYNMRVDEVRSAAYALKAYAGMEYGKFKETYLRDVPREVFEQYKGRLPDNWRKRAVHWYSEQERVEQGAEAWRRGDLEEWEAVVREWAVVHRKLGNWFARVEEAIRDHDGDGGNLWRTVFWCGIQRGMYFYCGSNEEGAD